MGPEVLIVIRKKLYCDYTVQIDKIRPGGYIFRYFVNKRENLMAFYRL